MVACNGKPGGAAACLRAKLAAVDTLPGPVPEAPVATDELPAPETPDPKVSDIAPPEPAAVAGLLGADTIAPLAIPSASATLAANRGRMDLSGLATNLLPGGAATLSPEQGILVASAEIAAPESRATIVLSSAPGALSVGPDTPQPISAPAFLSANGSLVASGWGRVSGPGISETATLDMPPGTIALRLADYSPPPLGLATLAFIPPPPAITGSITATGLFAAPPPAGHVSLIAPPPVATVEIAPVPVEVAPPETVLSPNVTLLPPPGTDENSAIVTIGGGQ